MGIAKTQYHRSLYRFAIKAFSEVIEYAVRANDHELKSAAQEYLGLIYSILQSTSQSKYYFIAAMATHQEMNDEKGCLRISEKLYELYYKERQFNSALWYSSISLKLATKLQNEESLTLSRLNKIASLIRMNRFGEAKKNWMISLLFW